MEQPKTFKDSILYKNLSIFNFNSYINHNEDKSPINPREPLSLDEALSRSNLVGIIINDTHQLIGFDLDGVALTEPKISKLLRRYPTYVEHTPSNKPGHFRIIYVLPNTEDKQKFKTKPKLKLSIGHIEFFNRSGNYFTLTANQVDPTKYPNTLDCITEIPATVIDDLFPSFRRSDFDVPKASEPIPLRTSTPPIDPDQWVLSVPCNRDHPLVQRYLHKHNIEYQTYWLQGIMSLHKTLGPTAGYDYADRWSQKSNEEYNPQELNTRWNSFHEEADESISVGTYLHMFNECVIPWHTRTKNNGPPTKNEIMNTQVFMDYHQINLNLDAVSLSPFLQGPEYALIPQYYDSLESLYAERTPIGQLSAIMTFHAREYNYMASHETLSTHLKTMLQRIKPQKYVNRFALYLEQFPDYNPKEEPDYLQLLGRDIIQRDPAYVAPNQEFHELLIYKWMLSVARTFWPQPFNSSAEGLLILHGPPRIGKSSLGPRLLPDIFNHLHVQLDPNFTGKKMAGMSAKDYKQNASSRLIVDYDEAEIVFDANSEADIKNEITATVDSFRPPYGETPLDIPRKYSIYASTNMGQLKLPREGERRYWWLNIKYIDTYLLDEWDGDIKIRMWKQIEYILKSRHKRAPWLLSEEEYKYLSSYLSNHRASNSVKSVLLDMYDWSETGYAEIVEQKDEQHFDTYMRTGNEIRILMLERGKMTAAQTVVNTALRELCEQYAPTPLRIRHTTVLNGHHSRNNQQRFLVPAIRSRTDWN